MSTTPPSANPPNTAQTPVKTPPQEEDDQKKSQQTQKSQERGKDKNKRTKGWPRIELPEPELFEKFNAGKSTADLADEYGVNAETIRNRLREYNEKAYNNIAKDRTTPRSNGKKRELSVPDSELYDEWINSKRIKDLAQKYGVSYTVIRRILLAYNEKAYRQLARIRRATSKKQLSVTDAKLYEQWKNGMSTRALAEKYKVNRQTITRRLREHGEEEYRERAQTKIAESIAEIAKNKISVPQLLEILERYANGESASEIANEFNVSRPTITRVLEKYGGEYYAKTAQHRMLTGRTKELLTPISELFDKWEDGETPENLEKLSGISYRQLLEKLKTYDPVRYKRAAERRGLGSSRARRYGARSLFELNVRRVLEKYGIQAKETTLKLGKHPYRPDSLIADLGIIVEAMGLSSDSYWKRQKKKTRDYLRHKYTVIVVVPTEQVYRKALKYLSDKVEIVRYCDFKDFVKTSLRRVCNS